MIKHLVLLVVTSYCIALQAQKASEEPYLIKTLANETIKHVDVETSAGGITVAAVNPSEAHIEVYIRANDRDEGAPTKEEIKRMLEQDYNLNISVVNNKLVASAKSKERINDWRKALVISFKVFVPKNVSTELNTSGGGISLKGLTGTHIFSTSGGGLHIENVNGIVKGRTSGGGINLINSGGEIDVKTSGGGITVENTTGQLTLITSGGGLKVNCLNGFIKATTSGGPIQGSNIGGELITHTSGGGIKLTDLSASLEASISGGDIDVAIKELGKYMRIHNTGGDIDLQLPDNNGPDLRLSGRKIKVPALANFSGNIDDEQIEGKLNDGGVPENVRAGSGRIYLSMK